MDEYFEPSIFDYFYSQWPTGQFVACDYVGKPVGFICATRLRDNRARIMLFAVQPEYRNKGIGKQLLDSFRMRAMMEGMSAITLEVRTTNVPARKFYRKNGFTETMLLKNYYRDGGEGVRMDGPVQLNI